MSLTHRGRSEAAVLEGPVRPPHVPTASPTPPTRRSWWGCAWRGRPSDPPWVRPALVVLLASAALLYLWDLGASGWANSFYSAAVQAGTKSWRALFFGSFDSSNFITVDKPPAALWVMELSARAFGLNAWSVLVPQALEGVATVALVYAAVRRVAGAGAGLLAGAVMALTPVAVLMFRFNNPDSLLVLVLTGAAYACLRALENASGRWLVLAGLLVGTGFITKMLQAFIVLPAIGLVYLFVAPTGFWRRVRQLALTAAATVVAAGWWPLVVTLVPKGDRPYVGGSQSDSIWNLVFGYNGFGRLSGHEAGSVGGALAGPSPWGPTGWDRLFQNAMGGQISWLVPAALVLGAGGLWFTRRAPRHDLTRASLLLWGLWLVITGAVFSFAQGIIHPYYTVALAPAVAALAGTGAALAWRRRHHIGARLTLAGTLVLSALWAVVLLERSPDWLPWLRVALLVAGVGIGALVVVSSWLRGPALAAVAAGGLAVALAGPLAYSLDTASTPHGGSIPSAGPTVAGVFGAPGAGGPLVPRPGGFGTGPPRGGSRRPPAPRPPAVGRGPQGPLALGGPGGRGRPQAPGGGGGLLQASTPSPAVVRMLRHQASDYRWVLATVGANSAAGYQLAADEPTMAIGGFNGTDPAPTLAQFRQFVAKGKIHYFAAGRGPGGPSAGSGGDRAQQITSWVESHFSATTVGGTTLYDLTSPRS